MTAEEKQETPNKPDPQPDPQHHARVRVLWILLALVFTAIFFLLLIHSYIVGEGSLLYDLFTAFFLSGVAIAMFSGLIFPVIILLLVPLTPIFILYLYLKNRSLNKQEEIDRKDE